MKMRMLVPFLPALIAGALDAQSCPRERARTVASDITFSHFQDCGGITFSAPAFEFETRLKGCPLVALYTPEHEVVEPSPADTKVTDTATVSEQLVFFSCERDWLLFIPIGSKCVRTGTQNGGVLFRRRTDPCVGSTQG